MAIYHCMILYIGQVVSRGAFGSVDSENASYNCSSDDGFGNATVQALCGSCGE